MKPIARRIQVVAAVVYGVFLLTVLLNPVAQVEPLGESGREPFAPGWLADFLRNIALFVPLGVLLARSGWSLRRTIAMGIAVSLLAEIAQLAIPGRFASATDGAANALGAALGALVASARSTWRYTPADRAMRLACCASLSSIAFLFATGWLLTPTYPGRIYFGGWTPDFAQFALYQGRLSEVTVGNTEVSPGGPVPNSNALRHALIDGAPRIVRGVAGPNPPALAPVVTIHDEQQREIMLIGFERVDVVLREYLRADAWGLERPARRWRSALSILQPGQPFSARFRLDGGRWNLNLNGVTSPAQAWTPGRTWALFVPSGALSDGLARTLDCFWIACLVFPVAYWMRNRVLGAIAIGALAGTIGSIQCYFATLEAATASQWCAFLVGIVLGLWCGMRSVKRMSASAGRR